jgi:sugar lactone lactonase YvrE
MKHKGLICLVVFCIISAGASRASAKDKGKHNGPPPFTPAGQQFPDNVTFTTKAITPFAIEGLTMDNVGNFYTTGRQPDTTKNCPVWKISPAGARVTVGFIPNPAASPCNPSGITFDSAGNLYIADAGSGGNVRKVTPDPTGCASDDSASPLCAAIPNSTNFAINVPGTNGLAFDKNGNLWTGDGVTGQGRVWRIGSGGGADCTLGAEVNCVEVFRIQPMGATNIEIALSFGAGQIFGSGLTAVGADRRSLPGGTIDAARMASNTGNSQPLVANGIVFNQRGEVLVADTARGAIWKVRLDHSGNVDPDDVGCDDVFSPNTLCLDNILAGHPALEGADGIALDVAGNVWVDANERNAVAVVTKDGTVIEVFRNPLNDTTHLRNAATDPANNNRILEFPTSPFLNGKTLCTASSDNNRRDNNPNSGGEINQGGAVGARGKISCMDQQLIIPGLPLPIH